jgi:ketosteroid isomerase-like protein
MQIELKPVRRVLAGIAVVCILAGSSPSSRAGDGTDAQLLSFSSDPKLAAEQRGAYDLVHRYEQLLNAGDTAGILALYAPDGVAEWNDKPTLATSDERRAAYDALFKVAKFSTVFGYAGVDVTGDTAVIRTFHHEGATVLEGGKRVVDLNREVFVLHKIGGAWEISLYIFNTNPVQGEG